VAGWQLLGATVYAFSLALSSWAMITNAYFSTVARIQSERDQQVCRTGPYRYVRHPGYIAFMLQSLSTAILLGSLWAIIPAVLAMTCIILRTIFEDRMLLEELEGYPQYAREVRYRLVPGLW
jgi:protein-S-isoprenylcysteine O-methyltransferase Ste14